jgi:hypothetical protein
MSVLHARMTYKVPKAQESVNRVHVFVRMGHVPGA